MEFLNASPRLATVPIYSWGRAGDGKQSGLCRAQATMSDRQNPYKHWHSDDNNLSPIIADERPRFL
jgi:hypothetical protein